jgi:hypothetical protein
MQKKMFEDLLGSVRLLPRSGHSRTNQPFAIGVCASDWRQRKDAAELGTGPSPSDRTGGCAPPHHCPGTTVGSEGNPSDVVQR